ncbi:LysR family substrate-binding domain-containing protein [Microbacterium sp. H1-D42]|uniref:LysR family substrate-binding domain-containing protein n=1 Tax=Microbacterium sp. H1-D42 TaxID=2925844 RepID=UPI001F532759|nr:LysR family substrate-binding domain-containing protein [Microbacterium sp. H1-D42]UNK71554.1 LysR family substrate-binding domain-containing protein [Microbacterium sp. H1-D42]
MKNDRRRPARGARPARPGSGKPAPKKGAQGKGAPGKSTQKKAPAKRFDEPKPAPEEPRTFRLGIIPGATPGKWIDAWKERMPHVEIELVPLTVAAQREFFDDGAEQVDAGIVRLPVERPEDLHVIPLYEEIPVVVAAIDSFLLATDRLTADDLVRQVLITPADDVLGPLDLPTIAPSFPQVATTEEAIATAASGVGIVVVPMSLARLHHRKDVDYRPLLAGPVSPVGVAWRRDTTTPDVDAFVGIVRGRTTNSSR